MTFEMRTYTANPGMTEAMNSRFRNHTIRIFANHGMESVGYWVPVEEPNVLVYILRHVGDPVANWASFQADPEWITTRDDSETAAGGKLVAQVESVYLEATDYSAIR